VNNLTTMIENSEDLETWEISLIQTVGLFGLYFTFFSGLAMDRFGPLKVVIVGAILVIVGYIIMAISSYFSSGLMVTLLVIGYGIVGIGSGTGFMCAMGASLTILPSHPGLAVSLPGMCMSLSMAFTIFVENRYTSFKDCPYDCWAGAVMSLVVVFGIIYTLGILFVFCSKFFLDKEKKKMAPETSLPVIQDLESEKDLQENAPIKQGTKPLSPKESILIFFNVFYWVLYFGFFCGIAYGLLIVTQTTRLWQYFTDPDNSASTISILFSFANATASLVVGPFSDLLVRKGFLSRSRFIAVYFIGCASVLLLLSTLLLTEPNGTGWNALFGMLMISVGFGWGFSFVLFPTITSEVYGPENFGICYSFVNLGSLLASVVVPYLEGWAVTNYTQDGFVAIFLLFAVFLCIGAISFWIVPPKPVSKTPPSCLQGFYKQKIQDEHI